MDLEGFKLRDGTIIREWRPQGKASSSFGRRKTLTPFLLWRGPLAPDGSAEFFNRRWLDYTGLSAEAASDWGWTAAVHTEDRDRLMDVWRHLLASGQAGEIEARLRRYDGDYRRFLFGAFRDLHPMWANCEYRRLLHLRSLGDDTDTRVDKKHCRCKPYKDQRGASLVAGNTQSILMAKKNRKCRLF
jgi:PAS domain-containing protein